MTQKWEAEKRDFCNELDNAASRLAQAELHQRALEADIERFRAIAREKEEEARVLSGKLEAALRRAAELEAEIASARGALDRLNAQAARNDELENSYKNKVCMFDG